MNEDEQTAGLAPTPQYRYADVLGNRLFLAGQVPHDADGTLVGVGDVRAQARRCLENLRTVVTVHGFGLEDIHQLTIFVVGPHEHLTAAWEEVAGWFGGHVPPATLLGVHLLGYHDQLVEIDAQVARSA
jgi:enamine deaminase RidA (YjgF/YER057c/UK114 family)